MRFMHNRVLNRHIFAGENAVHWFEIEGRYYGIPSTKEGLHRIYLEGIHKSIHRDLLKITLSQIWPD